MTARKPKPTGKKRMGKNAGPGNARERERRRLFIALYAHPDYARNGTRAAIDAGYAPKSAHVAASRLLKDENIREEIDREIGRQIERTRVSADRVVQELHAIGTVNLRDVVELKTIRRGTSIKQEIYLRVDSLDQLHPYDAAAIKELEPTKDGIRVRFHEKHPALVTLMKHFGGQFRDPMTTPPPPVFTQDQRVQRLMAALTMLAKRAREAKALPAEVQTA